MSKIQDQTGRDNCEKEFRLALHFASSSRMIPIVMEPEMMSTRDWKGKLAYLASALYIDFTTDELLNNVADAVIDRLRQVILFNFIILLLILIYFPCFLI